MASEFPAMLYYTNPESGYDVVYKPVLAGQTFRPYAFVVQDVSGGAGDGTVSECGADPALILGVVMAAAVDPNTPYINPASPGTVVVPVTILTTHMTVGLASAGTLVAGNAGKDYGITKSAAGNWRLDIAKTGAAARVHVWRVDLEKQLALCHILAANLQGDAIAS